MNDDAIVWVPMENRRQRVLNVLRRRRHKPYDGHAIRVGPTEYFVCTLPTGHDGPCKP